MIDSNFDTVYKGSSKKCVGIFLNEQTSHELDNLSINSSIIASVNSKVK